MTQSCGTQFLPLTDCSLLGSDAVEFVTCNRRLGRNCCLHFQSGRNWIPSRKCKCLAEGVFPSMVFPSCSSTPTSPRVKRLALLSKHESYADGNLAADRTTHASQVSIVFTQRELPWFSMLGGWGMGMTAPPRSKKYRFVSRMKPS